jgi:hypothetical protein
MFGFDQMEPTPTTNLGVAALNNALAAEGFPLVGVQYTSNQFIFAAYKGRTWLQCGSAYSSQTQCIARFGMTLLEWFGPNPDKKKCYIGFRMYSPLNISDGGSFSTFGNSPIFPFPAVTGEAYYELCYDPVTGTMQRWIDGIPLADLSTGILGDSTQIYLGLFFGGAYINVWTAWFTDIYSIIDTGDDTPCTRLGSVRVTPLATDSVSLPADWGTIQPDYGSVTVGADTYRRSYPSFSQAPYSGFNYTCNLSPRTGAILYHIYSPTSPVEFNINNPTVGNPVIFTMKFNRPTKVGLLQWRRTNTAGYFYPTGYTIEGSNDNAQWTVLGTYSSVASAHGNVVNSVVPEGTRGSYLYYRVVFTAGTSYGAANYFTICGVQFFSAPDEVIRTPTEILDNDYAYDNVGNDQNGGVVRTGVLESEAVVGIKKPVLNGETILKVQLRVSALRDGGSENRLIVNTRQGATTLPDYTYQLNAAIRQGVVVFDAHKAPDGTPWTPDTVNALELVLKSKTGAA